MKKEYITPKTLSVALRASNLILASETYSVKSMKNGGESFVGDVGDDEE